jgi:hypothetical protein
LQVEERHTIFRIFLSLNSLLLIQIDRGGP